eukprot:CAMPEP_0113536138 /NCGR_PEP_ID=MMETSP0015_2-20120614/6088_1 /TAXON_ID=2838 /ORGANISM="Odontella" /LENGTH=363 /DNA_ID=CAMNT_0000435457 /DNA_START=184 /DNA_END=1275 /DNA_ORIENTATION=- /assembly_acc=CAM_ASM_000160
MKPFSEVRMEGGLGAPSDDGAIDAAALNPQAGSQAGTPANTLTSTQLEELARALSDNVAVGSTNNDREGKSDMVNILDPTWALPEQRDGRIKESKPSWFGALRLESSNVDEPRRFREQVRLGQFSGPTNGVCPGFLQCNLVVLPRSQIAFDFLLFCQRNKKACPLVEVCDGFSPDGVALGADLRKDISKYAIYRDGVLEKEVHDASDLWPKDAISFLIGCSFSYDSALISAGIPLRSVEQKKNVPMYRTSLECRKAGAFKGNMVVSMKPVRAVDIAKEVEITSKYPHAHGAPVCVGKPEAIGIGDLTTPDWGDPVDIAADELPVFHACGVTPQAVLMESKVPYAITHSAGHMFVTDLPSDAVV